MSDIDAIQDQRRFELELKTRAEELVELLKQGDIPQAMQLVQQLNELRHQALYHEVGKLTRAVHDAIVGFTDDVSSTELLQDSKHHIASISDASDRLSYVIELTESNAHKTIDQVDESLQLVRQLEQGFQLRKGLLEELAAVKSEKPELADLHQKLCCYAEDHSEALADLKERLTAIMLAQEYQDITGQLIKRVIQLVTDIENELVGLMEVASRVNSLGVLSSDSQTDLPDSQDKEKPQRSAIEAEGPQMAGRNKTEVASNQDDVDDLLSSLGF
ncbi:protein phosphatase CheZ [Amphritea japonica]|uniref:Protein phosphatase CheZ n=1 Tax=Amphritea japonica ATCC BAA-1530 TaxID=1278309 RepID=A0A7R6P1K6_9GAMM|nr:protein phosphatase CheZ [Amphritea japonica]BBB25189.1 chemotaxis protein CheZ [Amphritea japonica ATCC BAA-1530]